MSRLISDKYREVQQQYLARLLGSRPNSHVEDTVQNQYCVRIGI